MPIALVSYMAAINDQCTDTIETDKIFRTSQPVTCIYRLTLLVFFPFEVAVSYNDRSYKTDCRN